jgi:hypothetical protein
MLIVREQRLTTADTERTEDAQRVETSSLCLLCVLCVCGGERCFHHYSSQIEPLLMHEITCAHWADDVFSSGAKKPRVICPDSGPKIFQAGSLPVHKPENFPHE